MTISQKLKIGIDSSFVSDHCATFWTKNPIWPILRREWGRVSACRELGQGQKLNTHFPYN